MSAGAYVNFTRGLTLATSCEIGWSCALLSHLNATSFRRCGTNLENVYYDKREGITDD